MCFSERIRESRLSRNLSLTQLAELSGVSKGYLSQLENGKRKTLSIPIARKIAVALGVDLNGLFGNDGIIPSKDDVGSSSLGHDPLPEVIRELIARRSEVGIPPPTQEELETLQGLQYRGERPKSPGELELLLNQLKYLTGND